ncbi:MAG: DUF58 domain-containing protein [Clostridiales bacterium]|nr:DUF58 domain-containing protein [Clostridiales bacterium]
MTAAWTAWLLWLAVLFALNLFAAQPVMSAMLLLSVLLPVISMIVHRLIPARVTLNASFPPNAQKGQTVHGQVILQNHSRAAYRRAKVSILICNALTGEQSEQVLWMSLYPKEQAAFSLKLKDSFCGSVQISCKGVRLYDFWGLTFRTVDAELDSRIVILPSVFPVQISLTASSGMDPENEEYSQEQPGPDQSELFELRDYTPGDRAKQIHWKITQKRGQLTVKEGGLPLEKSVLLLMETGISDETPPPDAGTVCAMAEALVSISQSLCEGSVHHRIAWWDQRNGRLQSYLIQCEDDLSAVLPELLCASAAPDGQPVLSRYEQHSDGELPAHIVCIAAHCPQDALPDGGEGITFLIAGGEAAENGGGSPVLCFAPESAAEDLRILEI